MSLINQSINLFEQGYSCSQAVLAPFSPAFGLDRVLALRIAQPFNGGMSRTGSPCGAVTGAVMVIGLKFGQSEPTDTDQAQRMRMLVQEFVLAFKSRHESIFCKDLLGYDLSTPEGLLIAAQNPRPKKTLLPFCSRRRRNLNSNSRNESLWFGVTHYCGILQAGSLVKLTPGA